MLHIVMLPWLSFDHITPFLELAKLIAQKGHRISFVSTPRNIKRLRKLPPNLQPLINLVPLPLPRVHGLPENSEATADLPANRLHHLKTAFDGLQTELTRFLETSSPDWVIYDFTPCWLPPLAARLGISRAFFNVFNAWFLAFFGPTSAMDGSDPSCPKWGQPSIPEKWVPIRSNFPRHGCEFKCEIHDTYLVGSAIIGCDVIVVRHCTEFEPDWLNLLSEMNQRPVIPMGLMAPSVQDSGDDKTYTWLAVSDWLHKQTKGSVVYIALGSELTLTQVSLSELALGLELSGLRFFWALRKPPGSNESSTVKLPVGFEERTKGRGIVCRSWVPQLKILGHDSVGGFLTHCGWSSAIEGLMFGKPLIMLPFMLEQMLNARILAKNNVGIDIPRDERDGSFTRDSVAESLSLVMVDEEGKLFREKAKEVSPILGDKARNDRYVDNFIGYLQDHRRLL